MNSEQERLRRSKGYVEDAKASGRKLGYDRERRCFVPIDQHGSVIRDDPDRITSVPREVLGFSGPLRESKR